VDRALRARRQEELQGGGKSGSLKVRSLFLLFCFLCVFFATKRTTVGLFFSYTIPAHKDDNDVCCRYLLLLLFYYKEDDDTVIIVFIWPFVVKKMMTTHVVVVFFFYFLLRRR
jgi:hypothetical protein